MKEYAVRLKSGNDLKKEIEKACNNSTGVILSGVGCLRNLNIRLAGGKDYLSKKDDFEIVSLIGTISNGKAHVHICASDNKGNCLGGHLEYDSIVNTTCELVIGILQDYESIREFDDTTGYKEIEFRKK